MNIIRWFKVSQSKSHVVAFKIHRNACFWKLKFSLYTPPPHRTHTHICFESGDYFRDKLILILKILLANLRKLKRSSIGEFDTNDLFI